MGREELTVVYEALYGYPPFVSTSVSPFFLSGSLSLANGKAAYHPTEDVSPPLVNPISCGSRRSRSALDLRSRLAPR